MTTGGLNADFRDLLSALLVEHAEFVVVGAYALALHGVPRFTGDLDVLVNPTADNAGRVWRALAAFGAPVGAGRLVEADLATPDMVYQIGVAPRRIDVLTGITGVTFREAWDTRETAHVDGLAIPFIGLDAFVRNKQATGRAKDLVDAQRLAPRPPKRGPGS